MVPKFSRHAGEPGTAYDGDRQGPFTNTTAEGSTPTCSPDHHAANNLETILQDESASAPYNIPLQYLKHITDNFSDERILGRGGTSVVYKGVLQSGKMVAVKRIMSSLMSGPQKQFESEVCHIMELKHPNIVPCVGYCYQTCYECLPHNGNNILAGSTERLICFEYMPKGSLDKYLSDASSGLDWSTRYNIIKGICYGLCHLHEEIYKPIIHLDLKPPNILLDEGMVPKITDFGLSRIEQQQTICTSSRYGTFGYMAPEFLHRGIITSKSDIFSLGVIILEVVTGHRDYPDSTTVPSDHFIELALEKWRNVLQRSPGCASIVTDCEQIKRCIQVGLICVIPDRNKRPPILKIINMIQGLESVDSVIVAKPTNKRSVAGQLPTMSLTHVRSLASSKSKERLQRYSASTGGPIVIGCIPYHVRDGKLEVLAISSRKGHGKKFPKSEWRLDESMDEAAQRSALSKAGVSGHTGPSLGHWVFQSRHSDVTCEGYMFPIRITDELEWWPEMASRKRTWVSTARQVDREGYQRVWMHEALERLVARHASMILM